MPRFPEAITTRSGRSPAGATPGAEAAASAWDEDASFRDAITSDPDVQAHLTPVQLEELFDPRRFLRNLGGVFDRLEKLAVEAP